MTGILPRIMMTTKMIMLYLYPDYDVHVSINTHDVSRYGQKYIEKAGWRVHR